MKPAAFDYVRPRDVGDAVRLLAGTPGAKVLAGGQTLGPMLNLRLVRPVLLVDITRIRELARCEESREAVELGTCVTHAAIEDGRVPDPGNGLMREVARGIAYRAVRTRGTIGGSLAHADPAADWLSCLIALDARLSICGPGGRRSVALAGFMTGAMMTDLARDEIVDGIRIPRLAAGTRTGYHKICRKTGEFAEAIGVAVIAGSRMRLVAGATGGPPLVIEHEGPPPDRAGLRQRIADRLGSGGPPPDLYALNVLAAALGRAIDKAHAA